MDAAVKLRPEKIVYISCNPETLARDLKYLTTHGYKAEKAVPVDMFPQVNHVETVCLLSQRKPDTTIEVDLDISELEVSSAETKATYEEIKSYVLKKFGLKVSNLYIAQVKRECGIVERINYNLPKTEGNRVPQCPEDKRKAIKDAFIHFQMI
jgi:23S rRNA (uracil1939-C5)-methyltransferase